MGSPDLGVLYGFPIRAGFIKDFLFDLTVYPVFSYLLPAIPRRFLAHSFPISFSYSAPAVPTISCIFPNYDFFLW